MTKSDSSIDGCDPGVYSPLEASELAWVRVRVRVTGPQGQGQGQG